MKLGEIKDLIKEWSVSLILLPVVIILLVNSGKFIPILDHINLLFHEGGHGVFRIFGKFIYTLGGSIMQILIPLLFIYYFYSNGIKAGTQVALVYLGQNILNISIYVSDASKMNLPLLGGNKVYHDWNYILGKLGLLTYDCVIGKVLFVSAAIIFMIAVVYPLIDKNYEQTDIEINL